ncbi:MAG: hypothetical protein LQ347_004411 [Umbilicaria vellea]|nr:MAG: hypothetical protein LQ347_004411 [Umbilicaria vellea]
MPDKLCERGSTGFRPTPDLHGTQLSELPTARATIVIEAPKDVKILHEPQLYELPAAESICAELCTKGYSAELTADDPFAKIPYGPSNNTSSLSGLEPPLSIASGSEDPIPGLDSAVTESDVYGNIPITLRLPTLHSGQHAFFNADRPSTGVDPQQGYGGLVSPMSPVSQPSPVSKIPFPSSQGDVRSSTINKSGVPNLRRLSDHFSSRVVSPLASNESACSTCGSTGTSQHGSAGFAQPANECIADGRGSYSDYSTVPASSNSSPKRCPFPPGQSEEDIAEKRSYSTLITDLTPRVNAENAYSIDGLLQNSLPLRGEEWLMSYPRSGSSSNADAVTRDDTPSDGQLVATPEWYHDATKTVFLTESGVLQKPQDPYVEYCTEPLRFLRDLLQESPGFQEVDNDLVAETTGQESRRGGGAQWHVQRLDCHPNINWDHSSPEYISPMDTISPSSSFGTTSPTESAGLCSLPATPSTQGSGRGTKRRRYDDTSPSSYDTPPDFDSINPRVAASTPPRNPSQQDQVSSDYLECTVCKASFKGRSKHGRSNLRKHIRIKHATDPKSHDCPSSGCTSTFTRQDNLRSHWRNLHKDRPEAELGLPVVTQKRRERGKAERIAGDMMDVRH